MAEVAGEAPPRPLVASDVIRLHHSSIEGRWHHGSCGDPEKHRLPMIESCLRTISRACAVLVVAIGAAALLGWALKLLPLVRVFPGAVAMAPNTAACLVLSGLSLLFADAVGVRGTRRAARAGAIMVALIGLVSAVLYRNVGSFDFDHVLFRPSAVFPENDTAQMALDLGQLGFLTAV